jgi:hypothetical protein
LRRQTAIRLAGGQAQRIEGGLPAADEFGDFRCGDIAPVVAAELAIEHGIGSGEVLAKVFGDVRHHAFLVRARLRTGRGYDSAAFARAGL